jgi:hypothetical protein
MCKLHSFRGEDVQDAHADLENGTLLTASWHRCSHIGGPPPRRSSLAIGGSGNTGEPLVYVFEHSRDLPIIELRRV